MFDAGFANLSSTGDCGGGYAAGGGEVGGGVDVAKTAGPVAEFIFGDVDGAMHVAGGDLGGAQECNGETGDVEAVATPAAEGEVGVLHGAPGGLPFNIVAYPVVDGDRVVVKFCGFVFDGLAEADFGGGGQVGGVVGASEFVEGEVAQCG